MVYREFYDYVTENGKLLTFIDGLIGRKPVYLVKGYIVELDDGATKEDELVVYIYEGETGKTVYISPNIVRAQNLLGVKFFEEKCSKEILEKLLKEWKKNEKTT